MRVRKRRDLPIERLWFYVSVPLAWIAAVAFTGWSATGHHAADLAGWIEASATVGAFAGAIVAAAFAAQAYRLEVERQEDRDLERWRGQAQLVAAWSEGREYDVDTGNPYASETRFAWGVNLRNASDLPVTGVNVIVRRGKSGEPLGRMLIPLVPPGGAPVFHDFKGELAYALAEVAPSDLPPVAIELQFVDSAGLLWARSTDGHLVQFVVNTSQPRPTPDGSAASNPAT